MNAEAKPFPKLKLVLLIFGVFILFIPIRPLVLIPAYALYILCFRYLANETWRWITRIELYALVPLLLLLPFNHQFLFDSGNDLISGAVWIIFLFISFLIRIVLAQYRANEHRLHNVFMILTVIFMLVSFETLLMEHRVGLRFQTFNVGANFVVDKALFWAPKDTKINWYTNRANLAREQLGYKSEDFRINFFGGSSTAGKKLKKPTNAFPYRIEEMLNSKFSDTKFHVVNAGVDSYTTFQIRRLIEMTGDQALADIFVLYVGYNDSARLAGPYTQKQIWEILYGSPEKLSEQGIGLIQRTLGKLRTYNFLVKAILPMRKIMAESGSNEGITTVSHEEMMENLEVIWSICKENQIKLLLCFEACTADHPLQQIQTMTKFAQAHPEVETLNIDGALRARPEFESYFFDQVHLNIKGHTAVAEIIFDKLILAGWIPGTETGAALPTQSDVEVTPALNEN